MVFFGAVAFQCLAKPRVQKDWLDWTMGLSALTLASLDLLGILGLIVIPQLF